MFVAYGCASTRSTIIRAASSGEIDSIRTLQSEGRSINEADESGMTALMYAIFNKQGGAARYLIESGADIKAKDKNGFDALMWAVYYDQIETINLLVGTGADIESRDNSGMTPLAHAIWQTGNINIIKLLIEKGANVNAKDADGQSMLDLALSMKRNDILSVLRKGGAILLKPEDGKARLFFIGEEYFLGDIWVSVGNINRNLNRDKMTYVDVDPGNHTIIVAVSWYETTPQMLVDAKAGQTHYFTLTPTFARKASTVLGLGLIPAVVVGRVGGTGPVAITPIEESVATEKIEALLKTIN
jgi:hypothetical protein